MTGLMVLFAFTIAGYGAGWYARGGTPRHSDELSHRGRDALAAALAACRDALDLPEGGTTEQLGMAMERVSALDIALEQRLGGDDAGYRRFESVVNGLSSVAHRIRRGERGERIWSALTGVSADLDALTP